ncbi:MAG: ROK family protein [Pseudaminobacter sp.]
MLATGIQEFDDALQRDCARVISALHAGGRKARADLAQELELTSTTTSRIIADLADKGIVVESAGQKVGRGRPPAQVALNPLCAGATILHVSSQELVCVLLDFTGTVLARETRHVPEDIDPAQMREVMRGLVAASIDQCPAGMRHIGTSVTVSGIVDIRNRTWILTSRWPRIRDFDVRKALSGITPEVFLARQLDVELAARHAEADVGRRESAAILHWGWGVGLAYRSGDDMDPLPAGPFGEIGHWRFNALEDRPCGCGNRGCLETAVSLWALLPVIRERYPDASEDEELVSRQIETMQLTDIREVRMAVDLMARALGNVCRILFPAKVFVTGPFIGNADILELLRSRFEAEGLVGTLALPTLIAARSSIDYVLRGAMQPLYEIALRTLLDRKSA